MVTKSEQLVSSGQRWYEICKIPQQEPLVMSRDQELSLRKEAEELLLHESEVYSRSLNLGSKHSNFGFMKSVLKKGTLADKLAAHTLLIQNSSLHNLSSIKTMMEFVEAKGKREYLLSADHLKELFLADLLPSNRKLKTFSQLIRLMDRDLGDKERKVYLMVSFFEDQVKHYYRNFVEVIERNSHDQIIATKNKSVNLMYELLSGSSEHEQFLLEHLANKLGDPIPKAASHACQLLRTLVTTDHPAMKEVVVKEVERVLFRPNLRERAQYYCLCFLQEVVFVEKQDEKLANRLIDIYMAFFKKCIEAGEVNCKTMKALLSGVSRALPFASPNVGPSVLRQHLETFYRMIYLVNTNIGIQVLSLIFQVLSMIKTTNTSSTETTSLKVKQQLMNNKNKEKKTTVHPEPQETNIPGTTSSQDDKIDSNMRLKDRFYSALYRFLLQKDVFESTTRPGMLFNLLYRCLKSDDKFSRRCVFIKRLLQMCCSCGPQFATSILYLVSQVLNKESVAILFNAEASGAKTTTSVDAAKRKPRDSGIKMKHHNKKQKHDKEEALLKETLDRQESLGKEESCDVKKNAQVTENARNPLFVSPDRAWEMQFLTQHFHPSVSMFASKIKDAPEDKLEYDGDPLDDFSLKHFLDRFVHRTPKKLDKRDVMVAKQASLFGRQSRRNRETSKRSVYESLSNREVIHLNEENIPVEETFIYKFLQSRDFGSAEDAKSDEDIESVSSNEFEHVMDRFENDFEKDGFEIEQEFKQNKKKSKSKSTLKCERGDEDESEEEDSEDDFDEDMDSDEDDELDFEDDDDYISQMKELMDDEDNEDFFESGDEDEGDQDEKEVSRSRIKKKRGSETQDLFASAQQFAHLLRGDDDVNDCGSMGQIDNDNDEEEVTRVSSKRNVRQTRAGTTRKRRGNERTPSGSQSKRKNNKPLKKQEPKRGDKRKNSLSKKKAFKGPSVKRRMNKKLK